jgi:RNA polymerase sigma-54 factor
MLKQKLQQKLLQKLSPQQIQMIKLLEIPAMQLEQRIKKELEENPILEEGEDEDPETVTQDEDDRTDENDQDNEEFSLEDYIEDDDTPNYKLSTNNYSDDGKRPDIPFTSTSGFHAHLESQLGLRSLTERQEILAQYILGNIDDDGYLRRRLEAIVDDLAFTQNITTSEEELFEVLQIVQDFDPPGVGARDLQECILLQLERKNQSSHTVVLARKIMKSHFQEFTRKHFDKILKRMNISEDDLKIAIDEILKLNPKPGSSYSDPLSPSAQHIVPDFILDIKDGEFVLSLNSHNVPELRINRTYSEMLETYAHQKNKRTREDRDTITFVKQKLDSARWFIDAIIQRQNTLLLTMNAIIEYQREYFADGDETKLKPMILKNIAEKTGLDISTISRVANSKYIQTHFGIFPLKSFFSEGLQNELGEEVSTREIKNILAECIDNEDKRKPLTDEKLVSILKTKGYNLARRTVAKYREQLHIPVARLRKEL